MKRRSFLGAGLAAALAGGRVFGDDAPIVMTVLGPIAPESLGRTLPHEHVLVDFIGADKIGPGRYDPDEVARVARPHLERLAQQGCRALVECTPAYIGRDPRLLKRLARETGLHLLTNTGYYNAGGGKYLPVHARTESADDIAKRWLAEWTDGIEGTGIRPGFIKIGMDAGPLAPESRKLVQAAARVHRRSGLTIAAHTGDGVAALEELAILAEEGVAGEAFVWVHAQSEPDPAKHEQAAKLGASVEFDGVGPDPETIKRHVELVLELRKRGLLDRVLISHDAGRYHVGEPGGGEFRGYDVAFGPFREALKRSGLTDAEFDRLTIANPQAAFTIRPRLRQS